MHNWKNRYGNMDLPKTSLSCGLPVRARLLSSPAVREPVTSVFPVVTAEAVLPYVCYRRKALTGTPVKAPGRGSDAADMELMVCAASYDASLELAEAVRDALDGQAWTDEASGMRVRSCVLTDAAEYYEADAYVQLLTFCVRSGGI